MSKFSLISKTVSGIFACLIVFAGGADVAGAQDSGSCTPNAGKRCYEGDLYWYDSCGNRGEVSQECGGDNLTSKYKCNGEWVQREKLVGDCTNNACVKNSSWTNVQNCAETNKICVNGACSVGDVTPPAISGMSPTGTVRSASVTLSVTTDEPANCRYSWYNKQYDQMILSFNTENGLYHTVTAPSPSAGDCLYYVRCRDTMGNANPVPVKIIFKYAPVAGGDTAVATTQTTGAADTTPPVISDLKLISNTAAAKPAISLKTDENAYCRYDSADTDYESMANPIGDTAATEHNKEIAVPDKIFNYYVRCKDGAGNKNKHSEKLVLPPGPIITGLKPQNTVYQPKILLSATVNKEAECRYSLQDGDFDAMTKIFSIADGLTHEAIIELGEYGNYKYYVRCKGKDGDKNQTSSQIIFEYSSAPNAEGQEEKDPAVSETGAENESATSAVSEQIPKVCEKIDIGQADEVCEIAANCVCDPDCPGDGPDADPDCPKTVAKNNDLGIIAAILSLVVLVVAVPTFMLIRRHLKKGTESGTGNGGEGGVKPQI